jgi:hypothetical protein
VVSEDQEWNNFYYECLRYQFFKLEELCIRSLSIRISTHILQCLWEDVWQKWPEKFATGDFFLQNNNVPAHFDLHVQELLHRYYCLLFLIPSLLPRPTLWHFSISKIPISTQEIEISLLAFCYSAAVKWQYNFLWGSGKGETETGPLKVVSNLTIK